MNLLNGLLQAWLGDLLDLWLPYSKNALLILLFLTISCIDRNEDNWNETVIYIVIIIFIGNIPSHKPYII